MEDDRPHTRYPLAAAVEIHEPSISGAVLAELHNISLSGCYLGTPYVIAEHTRVRIVLQAGRLRAELWGVVQRRDRYGLGIQFTNGTSVEDWKSLQTIIRQLESRRAATICPEA